MLFKIYMWPPLPKKTKAPKPIQNAPFRKQASALTAQFCGVMGTRKSKQGESLGPRETTGPTLGRLHGKNIQKLLISLFAICPFFIRSRLEKIKKNSQKASKGL